MNCINLIIFEAGRMESSVKIYQAKERGTEQKEDASTQKKKSIRAIRQERHLAIKQRPVRCETDCRRATRSNDQTSTFFRDNCLN